MMQQNTIDANKKKEKEQRKKKPNGWKQRNEKEKFNPDYIYCFVFLCIANVVAK